MTRASSQSDATPDQRIQIVPVRDRWTFLIDGKGDAVFDERWGITTFGTPEEARKTAEEYLKAQRVTPMIPRQSLR